MKTIILLLVLPFILMGIYSCDAEHYLGKAIDKGYSINDRDVIVLVHDTIKGKDGKDSLIIREIPIPCPEIQLPETRWRIRFDNKRFKDSLNHYRKIYNDSTEHVLDVMEEANEAFEDSLIQIRKMNKDDNKADIKNNRIDNRSWWKFWLLLGFIIGVLTLYFAVKYIPFLKKMIT